MKVKICGVTSADDALHAIRCGADYLGLNFYPRSPRCVSRSEALAIRQAVGTRARIVGVFVNAPLSEMQVLDRDLGLDRVQLHGTEAPAIAARFGRRAIKAFRVDAELSEASLEPYAGSGALLFDTPPDLAGAGPDGEELYGGTGKSWRYESVRRFMRIGPPVFIAGGVGPDNVASVVEALPEAYAVDVCSGVESEPGVKDPEKVEALFAALRAAR